MKIILFTDVAQTGGYGKYGGTYKVATEIRRAGHTCQVVDNFSWLGLDRLKTIVDKFVTDETVLIGISCALNDTRVDGKVQHWGISDQEFQNLVDYIKSRNSNVKFVAGGPRLSVLSEWDFIDYTVINKGDIAILKVIDHVVNGAELKYTLNRNTKVVNGNDYFYTQEEFAKSKILFEKNDVILPGESLPLEIARGCIFSCAYCKFDLIGKKIGDWTKEPETLYEELMRNYELFGTTDYLFTDELINESVPKLEMLCEVFQRLPFKLSYTSFARVDLIHRYPEMRELLLESGAKGLSFGIETFNKKAGLAVGKGMSADKVKSILEYCYEKWQGKIITSATFMIGLPGETEESIWETFRYATGENSPLDTAGFLPLAMRNNANDGRTSSKMDDDPAKFGYVVENGKWTSSTMNVETAHRIAYEISQVQPNISHIDSWINRYTTLGYSVEEIYNMIHSKDSYLDEINQRTIAIKEKYYAELMKL